VGLRKTMKLQVSSERQIQTREGSAREEKRQKSTGARRPKEGVRTRACHAGSGLLRALDSPRKLLCRLLKVSARANKPRMCLCAACASHVEMCAASRSSKHASASQLLHPCAQFPHRDKISIFNRSALPRHPACLLALPVVLASILMAPRRFRLPLRVYFGSHCRVRHLHVLPKASGECGIVQRHFQRRGLRNVTIVVCAFQKHGGRWWFVVCVCLPL
jgi:hypothetical protein